MGDRADEAAKAAAESRLPDKLNRKDSRLAVLFSWKVLVPLFLLAVGLIAFAVGARAYRRWQAMTYLDDNNVDYTLSAEGEWITDWFGDRALGLRTVDMIDLSILPDDGWNEISVLDDVTQIKWDRRSAVPEGAIAALKNFERLESAKFNGWAFSEVEYVEFLSSRPPLVEFNVGTDVVSNSMLRKLSEISSIERLVFVTYNYDPNAYLEVEALTNLRHAVIHGDIDDQGLAWLCRSPELETLAIYGASLTDEEMAVLASATHLQKAEFIFCPQFGSAGWEHLEHLPQLTTIRTTPGHLTPETLAVFERMPALTHVNVYGPIPPHIQAGIDAVPLKFAIDEEPKTTRLHPDW